MGRVNSGGGKVGIGSSRQRLLYLLASCSSSRTEAMRDCWKGLWASLESGSEVGSEGKVDSQYTARWIIYGDTAF